MILDLRSGEGNRKREQDDIFDLMNEIKSNRYTFEAVNDGCHGRCSRCFTTAPPLMAVFRVAQSVDPPDIGGEWNHHPPDRNRLVVGHGSGFSVSGGSIFTGESGGKPRGSEADAENGAGNKLHEEIAILNLHCHLCKWVTVGTCTHRQPPGPGSPGTRHVRELTRTG